MHHTLIPLAERKRLHREYYMRVTIVSVVAISCAIIVGVAALFPAYIRAWFDRYAAQGAVAAVRSTANADKQLNAAKAELGSDNMLVTTLVADEQPRFSDLVRSIAAVRRSVLIAGFSFAFADAKTISVTLSGVAPTRDDLLSFKARLEAAFPGTKIDIPISQLAKSSNIQYSLKFNLQTP